MQIYNMRKYNDGSNNHHTICEKPELITYEEKEIPQNKNIARFEKVKKNPKKRFKIAQKI